jgi:inner membrane protein
MDNLSHSVVGLAAGEFLHRSLPEESDAEHNRLRRRLLLVSGWLASNFPDLDLVLTSLLPEPLGYLLHHRGHTHTLLYAIPQAMLLWGLVWLVWPAARRLLKRSSAARTGLILSVCIGLALHLLMDYLNSYGIHPFYPFDSRWFYGDMVFIIEPLFWVAFGVPLIMTMQRGSVQVLFIALLIGALLFFTLKEFLPWTSFASLVVLAFVLATVQRKAGARGHAAFILSAIVAIGFTGVQGFASYQAMQMVMRHLKNKDPESRFLDASMTSFPANPLCWTFVSIESKETEGIYRLRRGALSLAPDSIPVAECPARFSEYALQNAVNPAIVFYSGQEGKFDTLRELNDENCHFNAWMRFARAPLVTEGRASDMRFSISPRGNFTTMNLDDFKNRECSRYVPDWGFPRSDLLTPYAR